PRVGAAHARNQQALSRLAATDVGSDVVGRRADGRGVRRAALAGVRSGWRACRFHAGEAGGWGGSGPRDRDGVVGGPRARAARRAVAITLRWRTVGRRRGRRAVLTLQLTIYNFQFTKRELHNGLVQNRRGLGRLLLPAQPLNLQRRLLLEHVLPIQL